MAEEIKKLQDTENIPHNKDNKKKKKFKVRTCEHKKFCVYKNIYWDDNKCLAQYMVWRTCRHKGDEVKIKQGGEKLDG